MYCTALSGLPASKIGEGLWVYQAAGRELLIITALRIGFSLKGKQWGNIVLLTVADPLYALCIGSASLARQ